MENTALDNSKKYFCIFGGGAIRGFAYLGAMMALQEMGVQIKGYAGSSVGAVFAAFAAVGYSIDDLHKVFDDVNFDLFRDVQFNIAKNFAISKGEFFLDWIRECIEKKYYGAEYEKDKNNPVTFKDLKEDIMVITSNMNGCTPFVFSKYSTPDFEIAQAVRISTALPGLFEPFEYDGKLLIDGDMMKSWPMWRVGTPLCPDDCRVLEFRLEGSKSWDKVKNSIEYMNAVFATLSNFATDYIESTYQPKDKFDYIKIDTDKVLPVQFTLPYDERIKLIEIGYNTTIDYFKNTLLEKRKKLLPHYEVILDKLIRAKNNITLNHIDKAKSRVCELFVYLCEAKRYIDSSIYDDIIKFKDYFFNNITVSAVFKRTGLKNKRQVEYYANQLNIKLLDRCMELQEYIKSIEE